METFILPLYSSMPLPTQVQISDDKLLPLPPSTAEVKRRSANYHPSIWGDHFLSYANPHFSEIDTKMEERRQELIKQVRILLVSNNSQNHLEIIDEIQRLGISYHFEEEINSALQHAYENYIETEEEEDYLHKLALSFRLFRQQGYNISSDVFNKLKDSEGKFKKSLITDVRGMLSLYEATHMRFHREGILDEALEFTSTHLRSSLAHLSGPLSERVSHALKRPIRKALERIEARQYISIYQQDTSHNKLLSSLASLDFNILQKLHQRELSNLTRWWKDLNFKEKLPFARDRMVECYFWTLGVYFEPQYCFARRIFTKIIILTSVIDDIYDIYATLDELVLFTDAVQSWNINAMEELPEYMRVCFQALLDVYKEMEQVLSTEEKSYRLPYAIAAMKRQVKAYFEEAEWYHEGYTPTIEEYMKVGVESSGYLMLATITLVGMKDEYINKETFDWVANDPLIVRAAAVIARLMDDMVGHESEQERGDVASAVECYMKQHGGSKQEALRVFEKQVNDAWKDINQEFLRINGLNENELLIRPINLMKRYLNLARVIDVLYKEKDAYTDSTKQTKVLITSLLIDPMPVVD